MDKKRRLAQNEFAVEMAGKKRLMQNMSSSPGSLVLSDEMFRCTGEKLRRLIDLKLDMYMEKPEYIKESKLNSRGNALESAQKVVRAAEGKLEIHREQKLQNKADITYKKEYNPLVKYMGNTGDVALENVQKLANISGKTYEEIFLQLKKDAEWLTQPI
jgi:hypothetical protein